MHACVQVVAEGVGSDGLGRTPRSRTWVQPRRFPCICQGRRKLLKLQPRVAAHHVGLGGTPRHGMRHGTAAARRVTWACARHALRCVEPPTNCQAPRTAARPMRWPPSTTTRRPCLCQRPHRPGRGRAGLHLHQIGLQQYKHVALPIACVCPAKPLPAPSAPTCTRFGCSLMAAPKSAMACMCSFCTIRRLPRSRWADVHGWWWWWCWAPHACMVGTHAVCVVQASRRGGAVGRGASGVRR